MQPYDALLAARPKLPAKDAGFADSLLASHARGWSDKQAYWAGELARRVSAPVERVTVSLAPIMALFERPGLRSPAIALLTASGSFTVAPAKASSVNRGALYAKGAGGMYFGAILPDGSWRPGRDAPGHDEILPALRAFASDP